MIESSMAIYIEEMTEIPTVVGARAQKNGINIMNVGTLASNSYTTKLVNLQISVRNEDLDVCMIWAEQVTDLLRGRYGQFGEYHGVIFIESVGSLIYEDDGALCHVPIFINVKQV